MKKSLSVTAFLALAGLLLWAGIWYSNKISADSQRSLATQGAAAEQTQTKIMENFKIVDVAVGSGTEAQNGDSVTVNYVGTLDDGTKFDSSYDRKAPFTFLLGAGKVIRGWDLGVLGMKVGGKRTLSIPPELGYGDRQVSVIPPNSTLHFTVELLSVSSTARAR